ncbi:MAG: hypothetical protein QOE35_1800 [Actinomycetota bacterium]|jgi:hypothetical protein
MLDSHPDVAVPDEAPWLVRLARDRAAMELGGRLSVERLLDRLNADRSFRRWGLPEGEVRATLEGEAPATFADAVRCLYRMHANRQRKSRYGDKTPWAVMHIGLLAGLFPEARFVHVIRDGRDVALSYLEAGFGPPTLEAGALEWRRYVEAGRRAGRALGPTRYLEARYEDLVASPQAVLERICAFLELPFVPGMLLYYERADEVVGSMPHPQARRNVYLPPTTGLRDWRSALNPTQQALFTALAGKLLATLDYEPGPRPTPRVWAAALGAHVRWRADRVSVRLGRGSSPQPSNE